MSATIEAQGVASAAATSIDNCPDDARGLGGQVEGAEAAEGVEGGMVILRASKRPLKGQHDEVCQPTLYLITRQKIE